MRLPYQFNSRIASAMSLPHSIRNARTGSMEAARRAGMMPETAAASTSTPIARAITGAFTLAPDLMSRSTSSRAALMTAECRSASPVMPVAFTSLKFANMNSAVRR